MKEGNMASPESAPTPTGRADIEALQALIDESRQLRSDIHARVAAQRKVARGALGATLVALIMLGIQLTILVQNRHRSNETRAVIRDNASTSQQIADCTTVGGKCYEEGTKRSAEAVRRLLQAEVEVAACHKSTTTEESVRRCLEQALGDLLKPPPPAKPAN